MFTSLTETNPASEYQNPPSRSSVFNGYSINYGGYLVSRILAGFEVILRKSNSESIEQITSAYADRDTDTLNKGGKCAGLLIKRVMRSQIIQSRSHLRLVETWFFYRFCGLYRVFSSIKPGFSPPLRPKLSYQLPLNNSHHVSSNSPIPQSAPARKQLNCDRLTDN